MASKSFGDTFRGEGDLVDAPTLASGITGATWGTYSTTGFSDGYLFQRSAAGATLATPARGKDRIARLTFDAFALGTSSGVAVFEWRCRADMWSSLLVGFDSSVYARFRINSDGTANWDAANTTSESGAVSGLPTSGMMVVRVELSTTNTKFFCNGSLVATSTVSWANTRTISTIEYLMGSIPPFVVGTPYVLLDYFNAKTETTSGALGAPASGDTTPPTMPPITTMGVTSSAYTVTWGAATDDVAVTEYQYSINGGGFVSVGNVSSVRVTGRTPGATDSVAVRAIDSSGNASAASTASVTLRATLPPINLIGDTFTGSGDVNGSAPKTLSTGVHAAFFALYGHALRWSASGVWRGAAGATALSGFALAPEAMPFADSANAPQYSLDVSTATLVAEMRATVGTELEVRVELWGMMSDGSAAIIATLATAIIAGVGKTSYVVFASGAGVSLTNSNAKTPGEMVATRIEFSCSPTPALSYYVDGALVATDAPLLPSLPLVAATVSTVRLANAGSSTVEYLNVRGRTTPGALGPPPTNATPPVLLPPLTASVLSATSYSLDWPAATDDEAVFGYEISINGGEFVFFSLTDSGTVVGRPAGANDTVAIRAVDYAGNASAAITAEVMLVSVPDPMSPIGPGNEPDASPFSDFWTRFNNTYEVP